MKEVTLKGTFYEMGKQFGEACKKNIKTFAKMTYLMASLAKSLGLNHSILTCGILFQLTSVHLLFPSPFSFLYLFSRKWPIYTEIRRNVNTKYNKITI